MTRICSAIVACSALAADSAQSPPDTTTGPAQSQPATSADDQLMALLDAIDQRVAKIVDVRAQFVQTKHTALLKKPLVSEGTLLVKGSRVRWDTKQPRPSAMSIDAGEIRIYYPEARVVEIYAAAGDMRELTGSPLTQFSAIRQQFDISKLDPTSLGTNGEQVIALQLRPKREDLKKHLKYVEVVLDTEIPAARKLIMTDADDERTEIEFKNVRVNAGVKDNEMELQVPTGTRTVYPAGHAPASQPAATEPRQERRR